MQTQKEKVMAAFEFLKILAESIREMKSVPNGVLYSVVMGKCDLEAYNGAIRTLKNTGLVREENNVLIWVQPT